MCIEPIVLGCRGTHMVHAFLSAAPGATFQVMELKSTIQQLRLIEPRSVNRSETRPPPAMTVLKEGSGCRGGVTGIAILDQINSVEPTMPASKRRQGLGVMKRVFLLQEKYSHLSGVDHQEHQQVDCAVSRIVKFLLLNGTRNR